MRKSLLLFLVTLLLPVLSFAQSANKAISKSARTSAQTTTDTRTYIDPSVLQPVVQGTAPSYSIGAWVNIGELLNLSGTSITNNIVIMGYGGRVHENDNGCWNLCLNSTGGLSITGWGGKGAASTLTTSGYPLNEYVHLMVSYDTDAPSMSIYLNGELVATKTMNEKHEWFTNETPAIYFAGYGFNGTLDEVQIYNKALTAAEVAQAKISAEAVDGLVGLYTFDEIAAGTTGQFENKSTQSCATSLKMFHESVVADDAWGNGLANLSSMTESAPTLVEGRELPATKVAVTVTDATGGTLSLSDGTTTYAAGTHSILIGTALTVTATPATGYDLLGITATTSAGTTAIDNGGSYIVVGDVEITASYSNDHEALTVDAPEGVTVALTHDGQTVADLTALTVGADYSFTVAVPEGKRIVSVKLGDGALTAVDGVYSFTFEGAATLTVTVEDIPTYSVAITQPANGTVSATYAYNGTTGAVVSGQTYYEGTALTLSNTPAEGYSLVNYLVNGSAYSESTVTLAANTTISAVFDEHIDYCAPTGTSTSRYLTGFTLADNAGASLSVSLAETASHTYQDLSATKILETKAGNTLTFNGFTGSGNWCQRYIWIDYGRDGTFDVDDKSTTPHLDLVAYDRWRLSSAEVYYDMNGNRCSDGNGGNLSSLSFTVKLPDNLAPGKYRCRVRQGYDDRDACKSLADNGSESGRGVIDITIVIVSTDLENPRTVTVASENETYGTVAIISPATDEKSLNTKQETVTVKATAAEGYSFLNWTDASGAVVSTYATYVYNGTVDATLTAHFGYAITYSATGNGVLNVKVGETAIASGTVVAVGTEVTVEAVPQDGYAAKAIVVDGEEVDGNPYVFTPIAAADISVTFIEATYSLSINIIGEGTVTVSEAADEATGLNPEGTVYQNDDYISQGLSLYVFFMPSEGFVLTEGVIEGIQENSGRVSSTDGEYDDAGYGDGTEASTFFLRTADHKKYVSYVTGNGDVSVTATFAAAGAAIEGIEADGSDAPVEYYNLQGVRVAADNLATGFYICRQGEKARKVFIKK